MYHYHSLRTARGPIEPQTDTIHFWQMHSTSQESLSCFLSYFQQYYLQLISQLENLYNVCTTYAHTFPLEQELVFRIPSPCPHHNKLRIHHIHNPYY